MEQATATFLFTDVEGSTRLLKLLRDTYRPVLAEHGALIEAAVTEHRGMVVDTQGDSFFAVFPRARDAVLAAVDAQRALAGHDWPDGVEVRVRMGIDTGEVEREGGRYVGLAVHRAARISAAAHGGQILVSSTTHTLLADQEAELPGVDLRDRGSHALKDITRPVRLYQVLAPGLPRELPRPRTRRAGRIRVLAAIVAVVAAATIAAAVLLTRGDDAPTVVPNSLVKIDPETGEIVDVFPAGGDPWKPAVVGNYVFVASERDETLSRIDVSSGEVETFGEIPSPAGVADGGDGTIWVGSFEEPEVRQLRAENLELLQVIDTFDEFTIPWFVAVGGGSVWVAQNQVPAVSRFDTRTGKLQRRYDLDGALGVYEITFGEGAAWSAIGFQLSVHLLRVDALGGGVNEIEVGRLPGDPTVGFGAVWVTDLLDDDVRRLDPVSGQPQETVEVGRAPFGLAVGGGSVWVTNNRDRTISEIEPETNEVVSMFGTRFYPWYIAYGHDYLWVALRDRPFQAEL